MRARAQGPWVRAVQVVLPSSEVLITNDGATILEQLSVTQPAAKMLVDLSKSQVGGSGWGGVEGSLVACREPEAGCV